MHSISHLGVMLGYQSISVNRSTPEQKGGGVLCGNDDSVGATDSGESVRDRSRWL